ncbi:rare lipoprotein A-like double-psi beta-barrel protein [Rhizoctonia solani AG-3 Rhs1AP]|uniref:Rare lipoprotein A-like double-psi beta-barrel protein n=3 Tax=Rhizoctonia solani AG-3 TaxID=1086053 RepID=A0A074RP30_9AGAM|nr:rare lipoprotein A-like double-psi beta-barrel protein [Rhizoctonia solani AG-3 Rhs1AP]KEP48629.1 rare lipoprotein A-like double-psi beta-barrel protein [Rhizoctonia solani 123E]
MFAFFKLAALVGLASSVLAAPVDTTPAGTNQLAARAPYDVHNGWASYYNPSVGTGACGWNNRDDEWVAAIGTALFQEMMVDGNPNHSQACAGKTANVSWNGKTIKVGIVDRCYACGYNDIDLSPAAFQQFAGLGVGKLQGVSWKFN